MYINLSAIVLSLKIPDYTHTQILQLDKNNTYKLVSYNLFSSLRVLQNCTVFFVTWLIVLLPGILKDKTMDDKLVYIHHDDKQFYPF